MGVYDFVLFEPNILPNTDLEKPSHRVSWQTRGFRDPMYRLHCVSEKGWMYRADHNYEENGFAESHGETGSFEFLNNLSEDNYNGYPREYSDFDWFRVRFVGNLRVTAQDNTEGMVMYDIDFDRYDINEIQRVNEEELDRGIRSRMGSLETDDIQLGETVYDRTEPSYEVLEIIDIRADEFVVKPETVDRGHVIHEERTVADLNKDFPADDKVVKVKINGEEDRVRYFPVSRIALDSDHVFS